jgi:hypothetical protein
MATSRTMYNPETCVYGHDYEGATNKAGEARKPAVIVEHPGIVGGRTAIRIDLAEVLPDFAKDASGKMTPERALKTLQSLEDAAVKVRSARGGKSGGKAVAGKRL